VSEVFELGPTRLWVVAATEGTTILGAELQPGAGSPWHTHTREDETIVVVSGELVVDDGERRVLAAGDARLLPRGAAHVRESGRRCDARLFRLRARWPRAVLPRDHRWEAAK
jgi:quercetin dioxygenase-like cupin family protein